MNHLCLQRLYYVVCFACARMDLMLHAVFVL